MRGCSRFWLQWGEGATPGPGANTCFQGMNKKKRDNRSGEAFHVSWSCPRLKQLVYAKRCGGSLGPDQQWVSVMFADIEQNNVSQDGQSCQHLQILYPWMFGLPSILGSPRSLDPLETPEQHECHKLHTQCLYWYPDVFRVNIDTTPFDHCVEWTSLIRRQSVCFENTPRRDVIIRHRKFPVRSKHGAPVIRPQHCYTISADIALGLSDLFVWKMCSISRRGKTSGARTPT